MSMRKETFHVVVALFILLMLSGSLGLLAGVFNDRIDGVKTHCFIAVINDSYFTGHDCTIRGHQCA